MHKINQDLVGRAKCVQSAYAMRGNEFLQPKRDAGGRLGTPKPEFAGGQPHICPKMGARTPSTVQQRDFTSLKVLALIFASLALFQVCKCTVIIL